MGAVVDFVADVGGAVLGAVGDVFEAVGDAVADVADAVGDVISYVAENPIVVAVAIAAPYAVGAVGTAVGASSTAISLATAPVTAGAITAVQGGDLGDIGRAAVGAFVGNVAGSFVGQQVGQAIGASNGAQAALASAAGGATAGATSALATGGDVGTSALLGGAGSLGANLVRNQVAEQFGLDPRGRVAEVAADIGEAVGRTAAGGNLSEELAGAAFSTAQREGDIAIRGMRTPSDAEIARAVAQPVRTEQSAAVEINDDIYNAITDRKNAVQVAFQGPVTPEQIQQLARNASLDLIETWKAKAAADPTFARELAKPENLNAIRAAGLVELATAVTALSTVAVGGAGATALATGLLAVPGAEVLRQFTQENPLGGALSGDTGFTSAIIDVWAGTPTRTPTDTTKTLPAVEVTASRELGLNPQQYTEAVKRYIGDFADVNAAKAPVTTEVVRVAQTLGITNEQASALRNSPIFDYITNQSSRSKQIDIDTMPLRERALLEHAAANNLGGTSINEDFNVIVIPGKNVDVSAAKDAAPKVTAPRTQTRSTPITGTLADAQTQAAARTGTGAGTGTGSRTVTGAADVGAGEDTDTGTGTIIGLDRDTVSDTRTRTGIDTRTDPDTASDTRSRTATDTRTFTDTATDTGTQTKTDTRTGSPTRTDTPTTTGTTGGPSPRVVILPDGTRKSVDDMTGTELLQTDVGGRPVDETRLTEEPIDLSQMTTDELIEYLNQQFPLTPPDTQLPIDVAPANVRNRRAQSISPRVVGVAPVAAIIGEKEPIFGGEPDPQQDVWNVRSLRLRRALGL